VADEPVLPSSANIAPVPAAETGRAAPRATTSSGNLSARIKPKAISDARASKPLKKAPRWATTVVLHQSELEKIKNDPAAKLLLEQARIVAANARALAPISSRGSHGRRPGYLRSNIVAYLGKDPQGLYSGVATRARAKGKSAAYYGRIQNQRTNYLQRGLKQAGG
jgi:hypothetical protein